LTVKKDPKEQYSEFMEKFVSFVDTLGELRDMADWIEDSLNDIRLDLHKNAYDGTPSEEDETI